MLDPITLTNETAVLKAVARDWETQVNDLSSAEMKVIAEHLEQSLLPRLHLELALLQHQSIITPVTIVRHHLFIQRSLVSKMMLIKDGLLIAYICWCETC